MIERSAPPTEALLRALHCLEQGATCRRHAKAADSLTREYYWQMARQWEELADQLLARHRPPREDA
jgi:hypothetical protein